MKTNRLVIILLVAALCRPLAGFAQTNATGYAADINVILDSQRQALDQAHQALDRAGDASVHVALAEAIKEMERSQTALEAARKTPDKLSAALAAEQAAYQSLLKATPREYRLNRSRNRSQGGGSGQPSDQELSQIEMTGDDNRYETEKQASAQPTAREKEQSQSLDRLKQLARRQQDLNDRLRDLQTALQEAKTDSERQEIQRQLKRLRDEERQLLSDVDEMRQKMEQAPDAAQQAQARQQLDQTRNDVERAAQQLENQSVSEALASGSRAEENLQNLRETMRQQSSSQFSQQMRQLRDEARDLASREDQVAQDLDKMNNSGAKPLDDSAQRQSLVDQMARQQSALTNMLEQMRNVTEQAETTEPLLSKQLYDIIRRADQAHTDNQLEMSGRLVDRGFLPQAAEAEKAARQNLNDLKQNVDRAAESILGSETDALRYAQKQLDDLTTELGHDLQTATNESAAASASASHAPASTNSAPQSGAGAANGSSTDLTQFAKELGQAQKTGGSGGSGPITGNNFVDWTERMRDVEQAVDSQDIRNQLATVRERVGAYRGYYRTNGHLPPHSELQTKAWAPLALARDWVSQELARAQNEHSLVPLDRDPVQDKYSDLVRKSYENLGSAQ